MSDIKQVIVIRKDLNMRKGKMIAQGAHASMMFITRSMRFGVTIDADELPLAVVPLTPVAKEWLESSFKKITVYVNSEQELLDIHKAALHANLESHLCVDKGDTEFHGVPTPTCVAIGPDYAEDIDQVTGHLNLL